MLLVIAFAVQSRLVVSGSSLNKSHLDQQFRIDLL